MLSKISWLCFCHRDKYIKSYVEQMKEGDDSLP